MNIIGKAFLASGAASMLAITPMPAMASNMSGKASASTSGDILQSSADRYRRRHRHHGGVDAGDILTGIGILAGIAIIADAASKEDRKERNEPRYEEPRYEEPSDDRPVYQDNGSGNGLGTAVSACTDAAERSVGNGARVNEVRSVTREGNGWRVEGDLDSDSFTCATVDGQVDYIRIEDRRI
jgi:hypothetical protein